jgi:hypothetical protein
MPPPDITRHIILPDTVEDRHGWIYFPKFAKPFLENGNSLWPERWPEEALLERKRQMGPIAWAQEMENNPIPEENSYFTLDKFEACYDPDLKFEFEYSGHNPTFFGVDSQANPDPKKSGDFGCVFVIEFIPNTEARRILWIERGRWGFRVVDIIKQLYLRYKPSEIIVENNNAQDFIVQDIRSDSAIPVTGFTTGGNKPDLYVGIPYLAATVANEKWIIPRNGEREIWMTDQWVKECLEYGQGHTGDVAMASWFANEGARKLSSFGFTNLPPVDKAAGGNPDFKADHTGPGDNASRGLFSPAMTRKLNDVSRHRSTYAPVASSSWRQNRGSPQQSPRRF